VGSRILLVEDDANFMKWVAHALRARGHTVVEENDGRAAHQALERASFDLVVVDGLLPDTDGIRWLETCRERGWRFRALFVSAFWKDLESFRKLTSELGVSLVVHKPIQPSAFVQQLEAQLPGAGGLASETPGLASELAVLQREYALTLPAKVEELAAALKRARQPLSPPDVSPLGVEGPPLGEARMLAHRLRGTAGSYGFREVGAAAERVEELLVKLLGDRAPRDVWKHLEEAIEETVRLAGLAEVQAKREPLEAALPEAASRGRVLVVDADEGFLDFAAQAAARSFVEVVPAQSSQEAVARAKEVRLDAALIELQLPDGTGLQLAHRLRALPGLSGLPLGFFGQDSRAESRVAAMHAGGSLFLGKPVDVNVLGESIHQLLERQHPKRFCVLMLDDDPTFTAWVSAVLREDGMQVSTLHDSGGILEALQRVKPDLLLLDDVMPGIGGLDICRMLRSSPEWQTLPILFVTARVEAEERLKAFRAGADDYIAKPVLNEELLARVRVRAERARLTQERMERDALTGLLTRRAFSEQLNTRLQEAARRQQPLSLCLADLDHFKKINDTAGHLAGDHALMALGRLLASRFRTEDLRGRWGGDEFIMAFPFAGTEVVEGVVGRVVQEFSEMLIPDDKGGNFTVGFSAGLASFPQDGRTVPELLKAADRRLYVAKHQGRGRVCREG